MNARFLFNHARLAAVIFGTIAVVNAAEDKSFVLKFRNDDRLTVDVNSIDKDGDRLGVTSSKITNPFEIELSAVSGIERVGSSVETISEGQSADVISLRGGDSLPGTVSAITGKATSSFITPFSGQFEIPTEAIDRVSFGLATTPIFSGPSETQDWLIIPREDPWEITGSRLQIKSNGIAVVDAKIGDRVLIDLPVPQSSRNDVTYGIGSNALDPSDKDDPESDSILTANAADGTYFTGEAYVIRFLANRINLQSSNVRPDGRMNFAETGIRFAINQEDRPQILTVGFDRQEKRLTFWLDGEYVGHYVEPSKFAAKGSALVIYASNHRSNFDIEGIRVRDWNGLVMGEASDDAPRDGVDVVYLTSGERFSGNLSNLSPEGVKFDTAVTTMTIPFEEVGSLSLGYPAPPKPATEVEPADTEEVGSEAPETPEVESDDAPSVVVWFGSVYKLSGELVALENGTLSIDHVTLGRVTIPFKMVDKVSLK